MPTKQYLSTLSAEQKEKEESARIVKQRVYLRIVCELWLVYVLRYVEDGVPTLTSVSVGGIETHRDTVAGLMTEQNTQQTKKSSSKEQNAFVCKILKDVLLHDTDDHSNLPLVVSFLKNYGQTILDITPRKQRAAAEQHDENPTKTIDTESVITPDIHALLTNLFQTYYKSVETLLVKMHRAIQKMERRNNEVLFARGELSEEAKQRHEKATKIYEKLLNHTQT